MTRETKIGLLVGLAFIIVIGILLSDHLTSATDPPPAALAPMGRMVRDTVVAPGGPQTQMNPVVAPSRVMPQNQVPTPRDLQQPTPPSAIVQVGGPSIQQAAQNQQPAPPITFVSNPTPPRQVAAVPDSAVEFVRNTLDQIAQQHGEQVVSISTDPSRSTASNQSAGFKEYVAKSGDSLSRIASREMGSSDQANQDAIIHANPALQQNPDLIIAGKTYRIPTNAPVAAAAPTPQTPQAPQVASREVATATDYWYTVQEGDNLWRIATNQLGNPGAVSAIKELNKDVLKGGEIVKVNMKLRLPSKPIARAN